MPKRKPRVAVLVRGDPSKPKDQWVTGDEPMTPYQASYLRTLSAQAHQEFRDDLTKRQASERIEELQQLLFKHRRRTTTTKPRRKT